MLSRVVLRDAFSSALEGKQLLVSVKARVLGPARAVLAVLEDMLFYTDVPGTFSEGERRRQLFKATVSKIDRKLMS